MQNWIDVYENEDFTRLLKHGKLDGFSLVAYEKIQEGIIDAFGISHAYLELLQAKIRIEEMYAKQLKTGDKSNQILIDMAEQEIEKMQITPQKSDLFESIAFIEKFQNFRINSKELTVFEFYKYSQYVSKSLRAA